MRAARWRASRPAPINCGCHGSQFSITDGSNVAGPSGSPAGSVAALPKVAVKVKGANVVSG